MEMRIFGRTGLRVSIFGFGCGAVGGLMVRGSPEDQERAVARALEAGVNYFDTAAMYGNGKSEKNLGRVLAKLKPDVVVGTKVRIRSADFGRIGAAVAESLEASLQRMGREQVDIFHLHNAITTNGGGEIAVGENRAGRGCAGVREASPAGQDALPRHHRRRRHAGAASGDRRTRLRQRPGQLQHAEPECRRGAPVRLSGAGLRPDVRPHAGGRRRRRRHPRAGWRGTQRQATRHPIASPPPDPIGSANAYEADLQRARRLLPLVQQGHAGSLPEAAVRFAITHAAMGTILVGMATPQEFEQALAAVNKGKLSQAALDSLATIQRSFVGEAR